MSLYECYFGELISPSKWLHEETERKAAHFHTCPKHFQEPCGFWEPTGLSYCQRSPIEKKVAGTFNAICLNPLNV